MHGRAQVKATTRRLRRAQGGGTEVPLPADLKAATLSQASPKALHPHARRRRLHPLPLLTRGGGDDVSPPQLNRPELLPLALASKALPSTATPAPHAAATTATPPAGRAGKAAAAAAAGPSGARGGGGGGGVAIKQEPGVTAAPAAAGDGDEWGVAGAASNEHIDGWASEAFRAGLRGFLKSQVRLPLLSLLVLLSNSSAWRLRRLRSASFCPALRSEVVCDVMPRLG